MVDSLLFCSASTMASGPQPKAQSGRLRRWMTAVPWYADELTDNVLPMCPSPCALCINLLLRERIPLIELAWRSLQGSSLCSSGMFGWYRVVRGCPRHRHEIAIGTQHYPWALASTIPPAHLLPVPVWSIVICKIWTGLSNFQLFGWQPAILIHRSTSSIRATCTLHFRAVIVWHLLLALTAAVTISALAGQGLPWCRLSVLYTLPLLHILEAAKGWSWAFDPVIVVSPLQVEEDVQHGIIGSKRFHVVFKRGLPWQDKVVYCSEAIECTSRNATVRQLYLYMSYLSL